MTIKEVIDALERFAPLPLQESYDNAGLQVGLTVADASRVLLCLDVTPEVVQEAMRKGCNLIVSHHPLIFHGLKQLCDQNMVATCVRLALQHGITIYSAHTNLDNAKGGVNYAIAERLGAKVVGWLSPLPSGNGGSGVVAELEEPLDASAFMQKVKHTFDVGCLQTNCCTLPTIRRVGICGGAGDFLLDDAVKHGCDAFLTGEMHYHQYFGYENTLHIGVLGHYESEQYTVALLARLLQEVCPGLTVVQTEVNTNPIHYL